MKGALSQPEKEIEIFMMAQFIDVMDVLDKYEKIGEIKEDIKNRKKIYLEYINQMRDSKDFLSLSLYHEAIDKKIENCKEIYSTSKEYKTILKKLKIQYSNLKKDLDKNQKNQLDEIKELIYELCDFDVYLAYKIGLIDGIKIKCT